VHLFGKFVMHPKNMMPSASSSHAMRDGAKCAHLKHD
jgi:hypothetical protein